MGGASATVVSGDGVVVVCKLLYERAPTQTTRIKRMITPTTFATMSRNESKLKGISRTGRRRRIMAPLSFNDGIDPDEHPHPDRGSRASASAPRLRAAGRRDGTPVDRHAGRGTGSVVVAT